MPVKRPRPCGRGIGPLRARLRAFAAYLDDRGTGYRGHSVSVGGEEAVRWTADGCRPPVENMRVDHDRADVLVPQEFLPACALHADRDSPNVVAVFEEMSGPA